MNTSHNPGADLMACLNALAIHSRNCEDGLVAETRYARSLGVDPGSLFIFDGAGSDERDHVTPQAMTTFYRAIQHARPLGRPPRPARSIASAFRDSLAVQGRDGDLATSERRSPAAGHIRAKTGTRVNVTRAGTAILTARTFVGYAQARSGRQIVLAVFAGGVPITSAPEIFDIASDGEVIAAAMQQGY
jgi:D-alanyl-D-alanine carboxypeptidase/D-alanyl-D-alanine-endopeptidase (penicillin-binding protein 4)